MAVENISVTEPKPEITATMAREMLSRCKTERELADCFAIIWNTAWWVEDNEYDYEPGTKEHIDACKATDEWFSLMEQAERNVFEILIREGICIPDTARIVVLIPFMERNGYKNGGGWWWPESESE